MFIWCFWGFPGGFQELYGHFQLWHHYWVSHFNTSYSSYDFMNFRILNYGTKVVRLWLLLTITIFLWLAKLPCTRPLEEKPNGSQFWTLAPYLYFTVKAFSHLPAWKLQPKQINNLGIYWTHFTFNLGLVDREHFLNILYLFLKNLNW